MDYKDYNDYELLNYIAENNEEATNIMYKKYEPLIEGLAKKIIKYNKIAGIDVNDLIQEGMLALSKAIDRFDQNDETLFYTYAKTCIERRMFSVIKSNNRLKRKILNDSISIEATYTLNDMNDIEYLFKSDVSNPENILVSEEKVQDLKDRAEDVLTNFEMQVFELKLNDFTYTEIADILNRDIKSVDNAIQRIKLKLKKELT